MHTKTGREFIGRFKLGDDLLDSLTGFCEDNKIELGVFSVIGAVTSAKLGYYSQDEQKYTECVDLKEKLEITSCTGNISLKDGEIFAHAHIVFADHNGRCCGGHLMPGTDIFAAEYHIRELTGGKLERGFDRATGLSLWT